MARMTAMAKDRRATTAEATGSDAEYIGWSGMFPRKHQFDRRLLLMYSNGMKTPENTWGLHMADYLAGTVSSPRYIRLALQVETASNSASKSESASTILPQVAISG